MHLGVFSPGRGYTSLRSPFYHIWCTSSTTQLLADRARNHITRTSSPHTHTSRRTHPESIQVRSMLCMSMTVDTAIRIGLHSAEVVQLYPYDMLSLQPLQAEERIIPRLSKHLSCRAFPRDTPSSRAACSEGQPPFLSLNRSLNLQTAGQIDPWLLVALSLLV